jgi:ABC-type Fe3+-hydroxamate transport system substrate-binding protein
VHEERWRFGARPAVERSDQIELVVSLEPDLVVTSSFADDAYMERLREAGIQVFDLGDTLGVSTTRAHIRALGVLLAIPRRAERLEGEFARRLAVLETGASGGERVSGMYLSIHGDHFLGGSKGTSYADVLHYAGVRDAAAVHGFSGWPQYDPEQLLAIDPSVVVTQTGMGAALRGHSLLRDLRACGPGGRIIEVPDSYLGDPGLGIVEAARLVQDALRR